MSKDFLLRRYSHLHVVMGGSISDLGLLGDSSGGQDRSFASEDAVHALLGQR